MFTCGLKESTEKRIELTGVTAAMFKAILTYVYTGKLEVKAVPVASIVDYIAVAHLYQMKDLAVGVSQYLERGLAAENVVDRYKIAALYELHWLKCKCLYFIDCNAAAFLQSNAFLELSEVLLLLLLFLGTRIAKLKTLGFQKCP
jgi:hypothetical protein